MEIRAFKDSDSKRVKELILSILTTEYPFDKNAYSDSDLDSIKEVYGGDRNHFFVIDDNGAIAGTVGIKEDDRETALLRRLFVSPNYRRKGLGKMLIDKALEFAREKKYKSIVFRTTNRMVQAIELCKKKDFVEKEKLDLGGFQIYKFELSLK